jgi:hypothetical protein
MLNNLTNYPDLIRLKAIVDVPQDTDLITLGVRNPNYDGNYRPALNTYRDFADSILAQVVPGVADVNAAYTLYVDLVYGNNATAEVGSLVNTYKTIAAATAAAVALGSSIPIIIHLRPGQYNEGIVFRDRIYYYAENGVVFYTSGASDSVSDQQAVSGLFGYAQFTGSASITLNYGCNLTIEFDKTDNATTNGFFQIVNGNALYFPKINISCNSLKTTAANANGCRIRGQVDINLNVKEFIRSPYSVIDVRGQGSVTGYTGKSNITCPTIVIEEGGQFGNNASYKQCLVTYAVAATSIITINGNLYNEVTTATFLGSNSGCISDWTTSNGYTLRLNGNIYAGTQRAILNNSGSKQFVEGNISTTSIVASVSAGSTQIKNSTIVRGDSTDANAIIGVGAANLYLNSCTIYNGDAAGGFNTISLISASSRVYANNVVGQHANASDFFMSGVAGSSAGMINVQATRANNSITSLYTATGFTQEANIIVPQYI